MKTLGAAALAAGILAALPAFAQKPAETTGATTSSPGRVSAAAATVVKGRIESIDAANRTIAVKGPRGNTGTIAVGPEVKNFDQMKVGDEVAVRYVVALALKLKPGGGAVRERTETKGMASAPPGTRPAAIAGREVTVIADVIAVDPKTQKVTLKGPKQTVDLTVRDPDQYKLMKVGDQIEATYTEAFAVSVEPAAAAAKK
jgi:Cu/Ag efflux protein CusF